MHQMHVMFIKYHASLMRAFVSEEMSPDPAIMKKVIQAVKQSGEAGEAAKKQATDLRQEICGLEPGDLSVVASMMDDFDDYVQAMMEHSDQLQTWTEPYLTALSSYSESVSATLKSVWLSNVNKKSISKEKLKWFEIVILRVTLWLLPDVTSGHLPLPLMTGSLLDYAWNSVIGLDAVFQEVRVILIWKDSYLTSR